MQVIEGLLFPRVDPFGIPRTMALHERSAPHELEGVIRASGGRLDVPAAEQTEGKASPGGAVLDTVERSKAGLAKVDPPAWREKLMDVGKKPLMQGKAAIPGGSLNRDAGGMRCIGRIHRNDVEGLPRSKSRKEVRFPCVDDAGKPVQRRILSGRAHGGGVAVQRHNGAGSGISGHDGDHPRTGTEIEHPIPRLYRKMLHERYTIVAGPVDIGVDDEGFAEILHQGAFGGHLAKLLMQRALTGEDTGVQFWRKWRL